MRRSLIVALILSLLIPQQAKAATLSSPTYHFSSNKIVMVGGVVDEMLTASIAIQMKATSAMPGPRLVLIRSPGGSVAEGIKIIKMLQDEKKRTGQPIVCAVIQAAHSMGFNILTHCDVRLATADATMVVHKIAIGGDVGERMTAKNLREIAKQIAAWDIYWEITNSQAMHLTRAEYDKYADAETRWTAYKLLQMGYLDAIIVFSP